MMRVRRLAFLAVLAGSVAGGAWAAAPATGAQGGEEAVPVKRIEEPVFQLPELVIIGENQVRIMAQREQFAASPMQSLGEAPLLEKEEAAVAGIRKRAGIPPGGEISEGADGLAKLELGSPSWGGASFWVGRQTWNSHRSLGIFGSQLQGRDKPGELAGGRDLGIALGAGFVGRDEGGSVREKTGWLGRLESFALPDSGSASLGWRRNSRDLPYLAQGGRRDLDRLFVSGEGKRSLSGFGCLGQASLVRLKIPGDSIAAGSFAMSAFMPVWRTERLAIGVDPRFGFESAEAAGNHAQLGADVGAAYIPGEKWRLSLGAALDAVWAGGDSGGIGVIAPRAGISWTSPWGPTVAVSTAPGLSMPWMAGAAGDAPYSFFASRLTPERTRRDFSISASQERWDGSRLGVEFRTRKIRDALSWASMPSSGLWQSAEVQELDLNELLVRFRAEGPLPVAVFGTGTWRSISTEGGLMANLPHGEGTLGAEYRRHRWDFKIELQAAGDRPGSFLNAGGDSAGYQNLKVSGSYEAAKWATVYIRGENLLGQTIELWQGYPEPEYFVTAGTRVSF